MGLTIEDLYDNDVHEAMKTQTIYMNILQSCYTEINNTHRYLRKQDLYYPVPTTNMNITGDYDFVACVVFLIKEIRSSGFEVYYIRPNILHISWENRMKKNRQISNIKFLLDEDKKTKEKNNNIKLIKED